MSGSRSAWSTPADIVAGVQRLWDSGALLAARLDGAPLFPYELRLRQPGVAVMGEQFEQVRNWVAMLKAGSRAEQGHGYDLTWRDINHCQLGRYSIPFAAVIDTRPAIYLRQLDIHGVDTKFIEARRGLFAELLDQVLPPAAILDVTGPRQFEGRYGLLGKPPLIRFRMLD